MDEKEFLIVANRYQDNPNVAPVKCVCENKMTPIIKNDKVIFICSSCDYTQRISSLMRGLLIKMHDNKF
jgi:hypothetical protein